MWKKSVQVGCSYLAIGVLFGIGIDAADEIHWRNFESERVDMLQQSPDRQEKSLRMPDLEPLFGRQDEERAETPASIKTVGEPDPWRPTPYIVNGKIQGYRVFPGRDRILFRSLGLKPGDLVIEIDGQFLNEPAVAFDLFGKALSGQPVIFSVLRGDKLEKIEVKID